MTTHDARDRVEKFCDIWTGMQGNGDHIFTIFMDPDALSERVLQVSDLRSLTATIDRVRKLADGWQARGESDMEFSKQVPEDVREAIYEAGVEMIERARVVRNALDGEAQS